jgi:hypothetical protein
MSTGTADDRDPRTAPMRFRVDTWDPSFGTALEPGDVTGEATTATVHVEVETPLVAWKPITPAPVDRRPVVFVDGVRRIDARVWIAPPAGSAGPPAAGICASWAAGAVRCDGPAAVVTEVRVGRALFSAAPHAADVVTAAGVYAARLAASGDPTVLSLALQDHMTADEVAVAAAAVAGSARPGPAPAGAAATPTAPVPLLVVDGPLRGRAHLPEAVGLIKAQHVRYLPEAADAVLDDLAPGERTPVFGVFTSWSRLSWYLRLPGGDPALPRSGLVRLECSADTAVADAVALADRTAALLPRFASSRHRDARAPQNLTPIAGLERSLKHRLGDAGVLERALRRAAGPG